MVQKILSKRIYDFIGLIKIKLDLYHLTAVYYGSQMIDKIKVLNGVSPDEALPT